MISTCATTFDASTTGKWLRFDLSRLHLTPTLRLPLTVSAGSQCSSCIGGKRLVSDRRLCSNCEAAYARARGTWCWACVNYRRRTGRDRPEALVVAHGRRMLDKRDDVCAYFSKLGSGVG